MCIKEGVKKSLIHFSNNLRATFPMFPNIYKLRYALCPDILLPWNVIPINSWPS